jgi:GNAT superfamily N-acetyltransferase
VANPAKAALAPAGLGYSIGEVTRSPVESVGMSDQARAIATIVSAFIGDPVERWMFPEPLQYLTHFPTFVAAFGGAAFAHDTVWTLGEFAAVAVWIPPGIEPDGEAIGGVLHESVPPGLHEDVFAVLEQMDQAHPRYRHWYLPWLGVDPARQRRGLGGQLLERCLEVVDADHLPAYLETPNPGTIPFYERHEFEVTTVSQAGACPPITSMLRDAH